MGSLFDLLLLLQFGIHTNTKYLEHWFGLDVVRTYPNDTLEVTLGVLSSPREVDKVVLIWCKLGSMSFRPCDASIVSLL